MSATTTNVGNVLATANTTRVRFFSDTLAFATFLAALTGPTFLSFDAIYDEEKLKMVKSNRSTGAPNPYLGKGLRKIARTQTTVNFNYETKRENRGGDAPAQHGTWHQAVLINNKVTPLSVHKEDIVTKLRDGAVPNAKGKYRIGDYEAVLDANGNLQFTTDNPRLYLRYEIIRNSGDEPRNEREMRSRSCFRLPDGTRLTYEDLTDYLPVKDVRTDETDFQVTGLDSLIEVRAGGEVWRKMGGNVERIDIDAILDEESKIREEEKAKKSKVESA